MVESSSYTEFRKARSVENWIAVTLSLVATAVFGVFCLFLSGIIATAG